MSRYGGGGEYGGGGFMSGSQGGSQGSPGGGSKKETTLRPVTIRQLVDAEQAAHADDLSIGGVPLTNFSIVAQIRNISRGSTNESLSVEDGTASMDARLWRNSDQSSTDGDENGGVQAGENDWVKVVGNLKVFNNKRNINVMRVRKITDHNEINYHLLDAIRITLYHERGPLGANGPQGGAAPNQNGHAYNANHYAQAGGAQPMDTDAYSELSGLARKVMIFVSEKVQSDPGLGDQGVNVGDIARGLNSSREKISEQLESLVTDGQLYTTLDDDHVLPT